MDQSELAFSVIGIDVIWEGEGVQEKGIDKRSGNEIVSISEKYFRLSEVDALIGNPIKAEKELSKVTIDSEKIDSISATESNISTDSLMMRKADTSVARMHEENS